MQGGKGSYNDTAIRQYLSAGYFEERILFLDSTSRVFDALNKGEIAYGQFAVHNSWTGFYNESLSHIAQNTFSIIAKYSIPVNHALLIHKDQNLQQIDRIITHQEVVKQCRKTIKERYGHLYLEHTSGQMIDPSHTASHIARVKSFRNTALIGNPGLAGIYDLKIEDGHLSDNGNSQSTFFLVAK